MPPHDVGVGMNRQVGLFGKWKHGGDPEVSVGYSIVYKPLATGEHLVQVGA